MDAITQKGVGAEDEAVLFALFSAVRAGELAMDDWEPALRGQVLRQQFEARRLGYRAQHPNAREWLILLDRRPVGWAVIDRSGDRLHCVDVAIVAEERSHGVGTKIVQAWQEEAAASDRAIGLSVFRLNQRACAFYDRLGFRVIGETGTHVQMEWRA